MKRMSQITGLTAVRSGTGRRIGCVERLCLSADGQDALGLVLRLYGLTRKKRFVSFGSISLWGEVTVTVTRLEKIPAHLKGQEDASCLPVLDTSGGRLGWMTDAFIEEESGRVLAIEISRGYWDDLTTGRLRARDFTLRPDGVVAVTDDAGGVDESLPPAESR